MAREQKPGRQPLLRVGRIRTKKRGLNGHDKGRVRTSFGIIGWESGGWSLGWKAAKDKHSQPAKSHKSAGWVIP